MLMKIHNLVSHVLTYELDINTFEYLAIKASGKEVARFHLRMSVPKV